MFYCALQLVFRRFICSYSIQLSQIDFSLISDIPLVFRAFVSNMSLVGIFHEETIVSLTSENFLLNLIFFRPGEVIVTHCGGILHNYIMG